MMLAQSRLVSQVASVTLDISNAPAETDVAQSATSVGHSVDKKAVVQLVKPAPVSQVVLSPLTPSVLTVAVARLAQHAALTTLAIQNVVQVVQAVVAEALAEALEVVLAEALVVVLAEALGDPPPKHKQPRFLVILDSILLVLILVLVVAQHPHPQFRKQQTEDRVRRPRYILEMVVVLEDPKDRMDLGVALALPCAQPVQSFS